MAINTDPDIHKLVMCANVFIRRDDGKFLVLRRSPLKKFLPNYVHPIGGKIDLDEDPLTAAKREVREETELEIKNMKIEAVINELRPELDKDENWLIFHFSADYESGNLKETEEGELIWLTKQEIYDSMLFPSVRQVIGDIFDEGKGTVFVTFKYDGNPYDGKIITVAREKCEV